MLCYYAAWGHHQCVPLILDSQPPEPWAQQTLFLYKLPNHGYSVTVTENELRHYNLPGILLSAGDVMGSKPDGVPTFSHLQSSQRQTQWNKKSLQCGECGSKAATPNLDEAPSTQVMKLASHAIWVLSIHLIPVTFGSHLAGRVPAQEPSSILVFEHQIANTKRFLVI